MSENRSERIGAPESESPSGEVDLVHIILVLWSNRKKILLYTSLVMVAGVLYALFATPVYHSQAIIAPKERDQGSTSRVLAQFTTSTGISQFGSGGSNLAKTEILLKSHELAEAIIDSNHLMPLLFPNKWDFTHGRWKSKNPKKQPTLNDGIELLRTKVLDVGVNDKKGVITVSANIYDSLLAKQIAVYYLEALNEKIRHDVTLDADMNRLYLEKQLAVTSDPVLVEKMQSMIGQEIEKSMLASFQPFTILESPAVPFLRSWPKRKVVVALALILGFFGSCAGVFVGRSAKALRVELSRSAKLMA